LTLLMLFSYNYLLFSLIQLVTDLECAVREKDSRIGELEKIINSSDSEKDSAIFELRQQVEASKKMISQRDETVQKLATESRELNQKLTGVAEEYRELSRKLGEQQGKEIGSLRSDPTLSVSAWSTAANCIHVYASCLLRCVSKT